MASEFIQQLRRYARSGVGVVAVRTRDPMSTASDVVAFCAGAKRPLRMWDCARGWIVGDDPVNGVSSGKVQSLDMLSCYRQILNPETENGEMPEDGVFCFINPHLFIKSKDPHPMVVQLLSLMAYQLPTKKRRVVLTVPPSFSFPAELQELIPVIDDAPPGVDALAEAAEVTIQDYRELSPKLVKKLTPQEHRRIAQAGMGMILPEFEASLARVIGRVLDEQRVPEAEEVRQAMLREKAEMVRRNRSLEVMGSVSLTEVGGLDRLKAWVQTRVGAMSPEAWEQGVSKPKGCALVGPPGTGKSLCGKVIGSVLGVATIRFDLSSVFSGLVGSSEENMREALFMLEGLAPCVVLLDEVDKAISVSSGGDGGTSQKVLGTLLTFMQETKAPIFWVPTLNRTQNVPAEFLRTGRLDQVFGVTVPNVRERAEILTIHLRARKVDVSTLADAIQNIAQMTDRYVGAELEGIASEARLLAYNDGVPVEERHLRQAFDGVKPLSKRMAEQFGAMEDWCRDNATPSSSLHADAPPADPVVSGVRPRRRALN